MAVTKSNGQATVIAVYPDHASAEAAVRRLQDDGIPMQNISIIGKDFQAVEKPLGFVTTGTVAKEGAKVGAWAGGIFGLLVRAAFLILPGVGPMIAFGPLSVALLGGLEGALAGAAFGGLSGALIGLGVSQDKAIRYESQVKAGKFLVTLQGDGPQIQRAKSLLTIGKAESAEVFAPVTTAA
jgi:Heat induced stress protein YflT domain